MYNRVYYPNRIRPNIAPQQNNEPISLPVRQQYPQFKEISPQANSAICAYMSPVINRDYVPQMPLQTMVKRLKMQGKIEGKDFVLEKNRNGNIILKINNPFGQEGKRIYYDSGDTDKWSYFDEKMYKGNKLVRSTSKNNKGKAFCYTNYYYNNEIPQTDFMPDNLALCKTPEEYIEQLKASNANYKIEYEQFNKNNIEIAEYNHDDTKKQSSHWLNGNLNSLNKYNKKGCKTQHIKFLDDSTEVTNYPEKRIQTGEFAIEDFPQENFSDAGITFKTTPNEYIKYLKTNNKDFKVFKASNNDEKSVRIKEYNDKNKNIGSNTTWNIDTSSGKPILKDIMHTAYQSDGSNTRVTLNKEKTYVEKFTP